MSYKNAHRVLVFGGRDYNEPAIVNAALAKLEGVIGPFSVIQGGARGADALAKNWARVHGVPCIEVAANWDFYAKRAGQMRNAWMLQCCHPTYGVMFPGGAGTANMRALLIAEGITVWEVA